MADTQALSRLYLFRGVPQEDLAEFVDALAMRQMPRGRVLCRQGQVARRGWLVLDGCLLAHLETSQGQVAVGDIREGEIAGETALYLDGATHSGTVVANRPTLCLELDPDVLATLQDNRALLAVERHLLGTIARRIRSTNLHLQREQAQRTSLRGAWGFFQRLRALLGGAP